MKTKLRLQALLVPMTALGLTVACGSSETDDSDHGGSGAQSGGNTGSGTGGAVSTGGAAIGGTTSGGTAAGGAASGGAAPGGTVSSGGTGGGAPVVTTVCGNAAEEASASLTCPAGSTITSIDFASFGTSTGECGSFAASECNAAESKAVVEAACLGRSSCSVEATNATFGGDPCSFTVKYLNVQAACTEEAVGAGGATGTGGEASGGTSSGGAGTGGEATGGSSSGGASTGGASTGGAGTGGSSSGGCPSNLMGWATVNADNVNGTTGGGNATPTTVTTFAALKAAAQDSAPRVIIVSGTIDTNEGGGSPMEVKSNKTIRGANKQATIYGGLTVKNVSNVIIQNLNIHGVWPNSGPDDTLSSRGSHHIWWDHLNVWDAGDGLLDITNASDYQTVSWSKFWSTNKDHGHRLASLNGSGGGDHPEDWDNLKVTYHHNWWSTLVDQRMPRVMYGMGHVFNNFYDAPGNSYCVGVGSYGAALIERNYFLNVNDPHTFMYDVYCHITARDNVYDGTTGKKDTGMGGARKVEGQDFNVQPFTDPPYDYTMDDAQDVPDIVTECAGPR